MTRIAHPLAAALVACALSAAPTLAQVEDPPQTGDEMAEGLDLFAEGARRMLDGLRRGMDPMLEDIRPFLEGEMRPFLEGLGTLMGDITAYHPPERLPNGDIVIRRRTDPAPPALPRPGPGGEIEL